LLVEVAQQREFACGFGDLVTMAFFVVDGQAALLQNLSQSSPLSRMKLVRDNVFERHD
jgi:hypothetical protein